MNWYDMQTAQERAQERYEPLLQQNAIRRAFPEEPTTFERARQWLGEQLVQLGHKLQTQQSEQTQPAPCR